MGRRRGGFGPAAIIVAGILTLVIGALPVRAEVLVRNRINGPIRSGQMQALHGTVHSMVSRSSDQGQLNGSTIIHGMSLVFQRSTAQETDLKQLITEQQTKGSPMYQQWLRPGQFAARYGMSASDLAKVASWLQEQGFTIDAIPASADRINFSGTAAQVNEAFQTEMHQYVFRGKTQWANATDISLPQAIAGTTLNVEHLNTFRPRPQLLGRRVRAIPNRGDAAFKPSYTVLDAQGNELNLVTPADIATIYDINGLYGSGITGAGQTIAIVGQTDILTYRADIANFRSLSGLDASNIPTQILVPGTNSGNTTVPVSPPDLAEADIDVEWSGAVAKDAKILYITVGGDQNYYVFDSLQYAIQIPLLSNKTKFVPVISISYGSCELESGNSSVIHQLESILEQANAQGQTVLAASGDDGSAQCDDSDSPSTVVAHKGLSVNYPSSSQYVTAVGGTTFAGDSGDQSGYWSQNNSVGNGSALSYIPETTWNDSGRLSASGGGASVLFSKPSWQAGPGVSSDGKRDVPDISLAADPDHDGYVLCTEETNSAGTALTGNSTCVYPVPSGGASYFPSNGNGYIYGGTSIAAPQMAAMIALMNQKSGNANGVGNANPILYQAAQSAPGAFHDVTTGSNAVACKQGSPNCVANGSGGHVMSCCRAAAGYDMATGLGSIDVAALAAVWPTTSITTVNSLQPTFSMVAASPSISISSGSSASDTLVLSSSGAGPNSSPGFSGVVKLACSNLPAGITCSFAPGSSVNLSPGVSQNVTLTLSATSSAALSSSLPLQNGWPMEAALAGVFGFVMLGFGTRRRFPLRWASRWMALLLVTAGLIAMTALTACGSAAPNTSGGNSGGGAGGNTGGGSGSSSSATTITVTGTSANTTVTDKIQLTIS